MSEGRDRVINRWRQHAMPSIATPCRLLPTPDGEILYSSSRTRVKHDPSKLCGYSWSIETVEYCNRDIIAGSAGSSHHWGDLRIAFFSCLLQCWGKWWNFYGYISNEYNISSHLKKYSEILLNKNILRFVDL